MDEVETTSVELPSGLGSVISKDYGEHHQGAVDVHVELPFPIDGRRKFRSTDLRVFVSADERFLFLYDACVLVRVDLASREVAHFLPPRDWYFHGITEGGGVLQVELYDATNQHKHLTPGCDEACFVAGMGPVVHGRFPSAFP